MGAERTLATIDMLDDTYELTAYEYGDGDPVVTVTAGIHGDETGAQTAVGQYDFSDLQGTVRTVPTANVLAAAEDDRYTAHPDHVRNRSVPRDLNRVFDTARQHYEQTSDSDGPDPHHLNVTEELAYHLLSYIDGSDYLIDCHTAAAPERKVPQVRYKTDIDTDIDYDTIRDWTRHSGVPFVLATPEAEIGGGTLSAAALEMDVPAISVEVGGADHFTDDDHAVYDHILDSALAFTGALDRAPQEHDTTELTELVRHYADSSGTVRHEHDLGAYVDADEPLAVIERDGTTVDRIPARTEGYIEARIADGTAVNQGDKIAAIAVQDDETDTAGMDAAPTTMDAINAFLDAD